MKRANFIFAIVVFGLLAGNAPAADMLMARLPVKADVAVEFVKASIEEHGYAIAHVQLCDGGMNDFGFKSDTYRVVFFGKVEEVRSLSARYPEMAAFLPLKMAVIAEKDTSLLSIVNPEILMPYFPDEEMRVQFKRWYNDIQSVFDDIRSQHRTIEWQKSFSDHGEGSRKSR